MTILSWVFLTLLLQIQPFKVSQNNLGSIIYIALLLSGIFIIQQAIKIILILPGKLPWMQCSLVFFLVLGGIICDVFSAVVQAFDWDRQIYTIDKLMLDLGFTLKQIYYLGFIGQVLLFLLTAVFWVVFLKAYPLLLRRMAGLSFWQLTYAAFCGPGGRMNAIFFVSAMAPLFIAFSIYRCYLGLACIGLVPVSHELAPIIIIGSAFSIYIYTTYRRIRNLRSINDF